MIKIVVLICLISLINGYPSSNDEKKDCSNYCQNDGICVLINNDRQCYCLPGWQGKLCENPREYQTFQIDSSEQIEMSSARVHACASVPANLCNGGLCQFSNNEYSCACPSHLFGIRCELPSPCNDFCYNNGICSIENNEPTCNCTEEFSGSRCHIRTTIPAAQMTTTTLTTNSYCAAYQRMCGVGRCVNDQNGSPVCQCPSTHIGQFCETEIAAKSSTNNPLNPSTVNPLNPSTVNPLNPSTVNPVNPGITTNPGLTNPSGGNGNACASNPCLNNRPCYNNGNSFFCYCGPYLSGLRCETVNG